MSRYNPPSIPSVGKAIGLQAIASRGSNYSNGLYNGTELVMSFKTKHIAAVDCYDPALVFGNYHSEGQDGTHTFSIKASIFIAPSYMPVFFNGKRNIAIEPAAVIESDPVGVTLKKGQVFYSIVCVTMTNPGDKFPLGLPLYNERGEGQAVGDSTSSGTVTTFGQYGYHPCAVVGRVLKPTSAVYLVGDSIMQGANDNAPDGFQDMGFATRALDAAGIPWIRVARGAGASTNMVGRQAMTRYSLAKYCTHAIMNYGTNDLGGALSDTTVLANLTATWNALVSLGLKVYQCTITPRTYSTDSWATVGNQTSNPNDTQFGPNGRRTLVNNAIRTTPAPLSGYFETGDAVESTWNSGKWKAPNYSNDGIHPVRTGHVAMADALTAKLAVYGIKSS